MKPDHNLLRKYVNQQCSEEENALVETWFENVSINSAVTDKELAQIVHSLDRKMRATLKPTRVPQWAWRTAVAASLLIFGFVLVFLQQKNTQDPLYSEVIQAPEGSNATLVVDNQEVFELDNLAIGDTVKIGAYALTKLADGSVQYVESAAQQALTYHTIKTATGGMTSVTLSDGSKVWLNAQSTLTYPIRFSSTMREVALEGEAYFEVTKQTLKGDNVPFYVRGQRETIQVLGTSFNASFYTHKTAIALFEGKVKVAKEASTVASKSRLNFDVDLAPNEVYQQGVVFREKNIQRYVDWKEGYFNLDEITLLDLSEKLSAWYGIPISIDPPVQQTKFFGRISRTKTLNEVLNLLSELTSIHYELAQNKIHISKTIK